MIYPPHFFKRYRERLVKNDLITNDAIIRLFFNKQWGIVQAVIDENFEAVFHSFENTSKEEKVSFVSASSEGYCFGEKQGNVTIIKTIEDQKPLFNELRTECYSFGEQIF